MEKLSIESWDIPQPSSTNYLSLEVSVPAPASPCNLTEEFKKALSSQGSAISAILRRVHPSICDLTMCGDPLCPNGCIHLELCEGRKKEYTKKGRLIEPIHVTSIIPHRLGFQFLLVDAISRLWINQKNSELPITEEEKAFPNVSIKSLLHLITPELSSNVEKDISPQELYTLLIKSAELRSTRPLMVTGQFNQKANVSNVEKTKEFACPPWLLYVETIRGTWCLISSVSGAVIQDMLKKKWNLKGTRVAVALFNGKAVPYSILAKESEGTVQISCKDAHNYKSIQVVWNKKVT